LSTVPRLNLADRYWQVYLRLELSAASCWQDAQRRARQWRFMWILNATFDVSKLCCVGTSSNNSHSCPPDSCEPLLSIRSTVRMWVNTQILQTTYSGRNFDEIRNGGVAASHFALLLEHKSKRLSIPSHKGISDWRTQVLWPRRVWRLPSK
jgi:hypothetical protein